MSAHRLESVDVARGLAALSVFLYHYGAGPALARITGYNFLGIISAPGAMIAVPLLVAISGFCIHLSSVSKGPSQWRPRNFLLHRFWRIYPAWLAAILVSVSVLAAAHEPPDLRLVLTHLALVNGFFNNYRLNPVLWTVTLESCLYFLYPLWLNVRWRYGLCVAIAMTFGCSTASVVATAYLMTTPTGPSLWFFTNVWIGWVGGAVLAELWLDQAGEALRHLPWWTTGTVLLAVVVALSFPRTISERWTFVRMPLLIILCIWPLSGLLLIGERMRRVRSTALRLAWRGLASVGVFSYSLFLLHVPLISARLLLDRSFTVGPLARSFEYGAWFAFILMVAWICRRWIENPGIEIGRRLMAKATQSTAHDAPF